MPGLKLKEREEFALPVCSFAPDLQVYRSQVNMPADGPSTLSMMVVTKEKKQKSE